MSSGMVQVGALPVPVAPIFGRDGEIARVARWFESGARLITLVGSPGSGKTRLSLHAAQTVSSARGIPALFLPLVAVPSPELIAAAVARRLSLAGDALPVMERVQRALRAWGPLLLVMDNLEHLAGAGEVVDSLLEGCPALSVLATSRAPLRIPLERSLEVLPFAAPAPDSSTSERRQNPAVQMFSARSTSGSLVITDSDLMDVSAICELLGGLPLAIELAAARASRLGVVRLRSVLEDRGSWLGLEAASGDPRHSSMRSAIGWSYALLSPPAQAALDRLSIFSGGFGQDLALRLLGGARAIRAHQFTDELVPNSHQDFADIVATVRLEPIEGPVDGVLQELVDSHLVRVTSGHGRELRYEMLESIREYGRERQIASSSLAPIQHAHAVTMLQFADAAGYELWTARARSLHWPGLFEEQGNLRDALSWACDPANGQPTIAARLMSSLWFHFQLSGQISEGRSWLERVLRMDGTSQWSRLQTMNSLAFLCWTQADIERAATLSQAVLAEWTPTVSVDLLGIAHFNLSLVEWRRGAFDAMYGHLVTAKPLLNEVGDVNGVGFCDLALGLLARFSGDRPAAEGLLDEALANFEASGHAWGAATARYLAGEVAHDGGDHVAAERIADGLNRYWEQGDVYGSGACVASLAVIAAERGEDRRAARLFGAAFAMCEQAGVVLPPADLERYQAVATELRIRVSQSEFGVGRGWPVARAVSEARELASEIMAGRVPSPVDDPVRSLLTPDQQDAVNLYCEGLSVDEIANRLYKNRNAIYDRLKRARKALDVPNNQQLRTKVQALRTTAAD